ncbi:MAG: chromosomal replication initiator protein DnaA [Firmicutes bacterium]|nr:chromosomal replication initiator protein DnaA [Bacillota bacterium]
MLELGLDALWVEATDRLQQELSTPSFETWVKVTRPQGLAGNTLTLAVPSEFIREMVATRYQSILREVLRQVSGRDLTVRLVVHPDAAGPAPAAALPARPPASARTPAPAANEYRARLNPKYVFEAFVVGSSNRLAHAACMAVAEMPARAYNPLFLYGGVGLGKTHLMHAIGHQVLTRSPEARVLYVSSENFTNEMINAIRDDRMEAFRQRYRGIDVLLIDDIQFVAGKERTQEEFFHTFEALHGARKQIVISSDRPPKDIPTLEDRLRSRFEWRLITDIQPPDMETRVAILAKKAQMEGLPFPDAVLTYIAMQIDSNIRELEGALIRVTALASITGRNITVELAREALKDVVTAARPRAITIRTIQEEVARYFEIATDDLKGKKRNRALAWPRQIAMYLARELTDASLPKIGEEFGGRDHTTVLHACDKIGTDRTRNPQLAQILEYLANRIKSH